jgi:hypothetical protein
MGPQNAFGPDGVAEAGGWVSRDELLEIGERYGYNRRGMAGFYQLLLDSENGGARLTEAGKQRLEALQDRYEKLEPMLGMTPSSASSLEHRSEFTMGEIKRIRAILREARVADQPEQKTLRDQLRQMGFYITDYVTDDAGFTESDVDYFVQRDTIKSIGG